jgi:hypothetical protein
LGKEYFVHHNIALSAVKTVWFVSDRISYTVLRGHWFNVIVLNLHAPSKEKTDHSKDRFYEKLQQVFSNFPKYHTEILLEDFNARGAVKIFSNPQVGKTG